MMRCLLIIFLGLAWFIGAASAQQVLIPGCTGNCSFGNISVTGSTIPANGLFLPAANTLGFATNSAQVAEFDSAGRLLIGTTVNHAGEPLQVAGQGYFSGNINGLNGTFLSLAVDTVLSNTNNGHGVVVSADLLRIGSGGIGQGTLQFSTDLILSRPAAATLHLGAADANPPVAQTLGVQGATGTNIAGANFTIAGSQSTGSAVGGDIIFQVTKTGASGFTEGFRIAADAALPKWPSSSTGASTQTFTNSPCATLTSEQWVPIEITGQTGTWFVPACH